MATPRFLALTCLLLCSTAAFGVASGRVLLQDAPATADYPSVLDAARALNLTTLLAVADGTVVQTTLESTTFQGIVLAPTNEAFVKLNESLNGTLGDLPPMFVEQVLQYHVIAANTSFPTLDNSTRNVVDSLLVGQVSPNEITGQLAVIPDSANPGQIYIGGVPPGARTNQSVTAGQARVYLIDNVLVPPVANLGNVSYPLTVAALANSSQGFSTLLALVMADPEITALLSDPASAYTLFAPNDKAFSDFLAANNLTQEQLMPLVGTDIAKRVLKNHVLAGPPVLSTDLPDGANITAPTLAQGDNLTIQNNGGKVTVAASGNSQPVNVIEADDMAGLSVVHVIDSVLLPADALPAPGAASPASPPPSSP